MRSSVCITFFIASVFLLMQNCQSDSAPPDLAALYLSNVLNYKGIPDSLDDRSVYMFADKGAWFGYSMPDDTDSEYLSSFVGPFLMTQDNGLWISKCLSHLKIELDGTVVSKDQATKLASFSKSGKHAQFAFFDSLQLEVSTELIFASNRTALINLTIYNNELQKPRNLKVSFEGDSFLEGVYFSLSEKNIDIAFAKNENRGLIKFANLKKATVAADSSSYTALLFDGQLAPKENIFTSYTHSFCFSENEMATEKQGLDEILENQEYYFSQTAEIWKAKEQNIISGLKTAYQNTADKRVAIKCLHTLNNNWRSAAGFLKHDGLFPSYNYEWFHGFWSWDSWKHAVAIAQYDTQLAQQQILAMYDFQDSMGMIADCVYRDTIIENHNWRDTKPPLSAWAIWSVYQKSKDLQFLHTMLPKVEKYHQWWYRHRDHDQNGLCEYGSTDGSLIAAKWESGMDNAVRFDETKIVQNTPQSWSMNRESVDLNAYLYAEKEYLVAICQTLKMEQKIKAYEQGAARLKKQIQSAFYDSENAWFFDINLETKEHLKTFGPEGWIPLWANVASPEQAASIKKTMLDSSKFATYIPFPTLAADHPKFKPNGGYWRGPVWLDQAYFAIKGLENYGYEKEAKIFTDQIINRLEGLKNSDQPICENYHPLTGEGLESRHFSWSAAHLLMLMSE